VGSLGPMTGAECGANAGIIGKQRLLLWNRLAHQSDIFRHLLSEVLLSLLLFHHLISSGLAGEFLFLNKTQSVAPSDRATTFSEVG
jgi:hypothetical protein